MPETVDALEADGHRMVGFYAPDAPEVAPFNFMIDGKPRIRCESARKLACRAAYRAGSQ
jgi:hypothetical protein